MPTPSPRSTAALAAAAPPASAGAGAAPPWWQTGVVYQVYPRSFQDSNGDGVGDLAGVERRLDHLVRLGIDALWISPFYPSPMKDFGYDVADYTGVDPIFGTLDDFDRLLVAAHARGLKVVIDWVPNHSSDQHPWFLASRSSREDPHRDWYVWADPKPDGRPPNNWLSHFGGPAWTFDAHTGQYYLHSFLREQPDLNWRSPGLRRAMLDSLRFWLDRGVDGFRIDVAHYVLKDPQLRDNPPHTGASQFHKSLGDYGSQLHVYDRHHPETHEVYREIRRLLDAQPPPPRVAIGEIHLFDLAEWTTFYGAALDELHLPFNFTLLAAEWNATSVRRTVDAMEAALPPGAWPNWVLGNHDEHRIASRVGQAGARLAMTLLLTLRGTPTVYYGDEIGMVDIEVPPDLVQDPWERRVPGLGLGRDPERSPMQWGAGPNAAFAPAGARPWLPLAPDYARRNVAAQEGDAASMLALTRALLTQRRARPALNRGSYLPLEGVPEGVFAYLRAHGQDRVVVLLNFASAPAEVALPAPVEGVLVSTHPGPHDVAPGATRYALRPQEGVLLDLRP